MSGKQVNTEITRTIRLNMEEKLAWAERSFERMQKAKDQDGNSVQDHFWSFLHAAHLLWFYFGRWAKTCRQGSTAKELLSGWRDQRLTCEERAAWDCLACLRVEDAHVQPVLTKKPSAAGIMVSKEGRVLVSRDGRIVVSKEKPFRVVHDGAEIELFPTCEIDLRALRKFVGGFDRVG